MEINIEIKELSRSDTILFFNTLRLFANRILKDDQNIEIEADKKTFKILKEHIDSIKKIGLEEKKNDKKSSGI